MKIKEGQKIEVRSRRKGVYKAVAMKDFDTEKDEFYPVATLEFVRGLSTVWNAGEAVPCRRGTSAIIIEPEE